MNELRGDTVIYLIKYLLSFGLLFIFIPRLVFVCGFKDVTKSIVSNYIRLIFWLIVIGYFLIVIKLFELISVIAVLVVFWLYKYNRQRILENKINKNLTDDVNVMLIDHVERIERIQGKLLIRWERGADKFRQIVSWYFGDIRTVTGVILLTAIVGYSAYLCFTDVLQFASPPGFEGYLSLIRTKYAEHRILFQDGIYPQGFYILLAVLQKFAQIDHLYIINFTGPLHGIIIGLGMYFFASRSGAGKPAGIIAAAVFCWLGSFSPLSQTLRTVAGPVQMSVMLVFPVMYFYYRYIFSKDKEDLSIALMGTAAAGLIHPVGFVFIVIGAIALFVSAFLRDIKRAVGLIISFTGIIFTSAVVAVTPASAGVLAGFEYNMAAVLTVFGSDGSLSMPVLTYYDYAALAALALIFVNSLIKIKSKEDFIGKFSVFIFGSIAVFAYAFSYMLGSRYLFDTANMLWILLVPVVAAFGFAAVFELLGKILGMKDFGYFLCIIALGAALVFLPQQPLTAKRTVSEQLARQYLLIRKEFRPTQWMMVSGEEGYMLAYGYGFHMLTDEFLDTYSPWSRKLTAKSGLLSKELGTQDILIICEKSDDNFNRIKKWIGEYSLYHKNISLFFADDGMEVWNIHQEPSREEMIKGMWEE